MFSSLLFCSISHQSVQRKSIEIWEKVGHQEKKRERGGVISMHLPRLDSFFNGISIVSQQTERRNSARLGSFFDAGRRASRNVLFIANHVRRSERRESTRNWVSRMEWARGIPERRMGNSAIPEPPYLDEEEKEEQGRRFRNSMVKCLRTFAVNHSSLISRLFVLFCFESSARTFLAAVRKTFLVSKIKSEYKWREIQMNDLQS